MKKHLLFSFLVLLIGFQAGISQTYIWGGPGDKNSEFNGGLNDWTTTGDPVAALWIWKANGKADQGSFYKNAAFDKINSPSVSNGAAVFDSDFYDNGGDYATDPELGDGIAAAPQKSDLVSPTFSCANFTSVYVQFYQFHRNFKATNTLSVSVDGGLTWKDPITINGNIGIYGNINSKNLIDITEQAAGYANVKIKFTWDGDYYFWIIDDVSVISDPETDPRIIGTWYPSMHYNIPQYMADRDSMYFVMDLINASKKPVTNIEAKVTLYHQKLNKTYFSDSKIFDLGIDTVRIRFDSYLLPANCDTGIYYVDYQIIGSNYPSSLQKLHRQIFRINPEVFVRTEYPFKVFKTGFSNTDENLYGYAYGTNTERYNLNYYKVGDWVPNENLKIKAVSSTYTVVENSGDFISFDAVLSLHEISDDIDNLLSNFNADDGIGIDGKESSQLTYVGYGITSFENVPMWSPVTVPLFDRLTDEDGIELKPKKKYFIAVYYPESTTTYFQRVDNENGRGVTYIRYYYYGQKRIVKNDTLPQQIVSLSYQPGENGGFYLPTGQGYGNLVYQIDLGLNVWKNTNLTNDELLPDNSLTIVQNPVIDQLSLDIKFDNVVDHATVVIHGLDGSLLNMRNIYKADSSRIDFKTGHYPAGEYLVTLFTRDKLISKKFVVAK